MVRHDETIIKRNCGLVRVRVAIIKEQKYTVGHESLSIVTQVSTCVSSVEFCVSDLSEKLETRAFSQNHFYLPEGTNELISRDQT